MPRTGRKRGESELGPGAIGRVAGMPAEERDAILRKMKRAGVSIRQAQRLTGVGKKIVERAQVTNHRPLSLP